jgi:hypothetical protein
MKSFPFYCFTDSSVSPLNSDLTGHKSSGDHDGRYYTENEINSKLAYSSGSAAINTTYVSTLSTTYARWKKWGRIVVVELYDINLKPGYSSDNVSIVATGFPTATDNVITSIVGHNTGVSVATQTRLRIDTGGVLKPWYVGVYSDVVSINGTFAYVSAS